MNFVEVVPLHVLAVGFCNEPTQMKTGGCSWMVCMACMVMVGSSQRKVPILLACERGGDLYDTFPGGDFLEL